MGAHRWVALLAMCVAAPASGCGDDTAASMAEAGTPDAGGGDAGADAGPRGELPSGAVLATPAPAELPRLETCPPGWRPERGACEPWPAGGEPPCAADEALWPGAAACERIGPACPPDGVPADLPASGVLHVRAGAAAGGDGSRAAPFATIGAATAVATSGTTIAVAAGDYEEAVVLGAGVTLAGACVADTHLGYATRDAAPGTVVAGGMDVTVRGVSISSGRSALVVGAGASATIEGVILERGTYIGLDVREGGVASIDRSIIRDTQPEPGDPPTGHAIAVQSGGRVTATRLRMERSITSAVIADAAGSELHVSDSVIDDTRPSLDDDMLGTAAIAQREAQITLDRVVMTRSHFFGVHTITPGTAIIVRDCVIRDVADGRAGLGMALAAFDGSTIVAERTLLDRATETGAGAAGGGHLELRDVVIRDTQPNAIRAKGVGLLATTEGSEVVLERVLIEDVRAAGLIANNDALIRGTDVTVRGVGFEESTDAGGYGVWGQNRSRIELERVLVERASGKGMMAVIAAQVTVRDAVIRETRPAIEGVLQGMAIGIHVLDVARFEVERGAIEDAIGWGIALSGPNHTFVGRDLRVTHVAPIEMPLVLGTYAVGRGIDGQDVGTTTIERAIIEDAGDVGLNVYGGTAEISDVLVRETRPDAATRQGGVGLMIAGGAYVVGRQIRLAGNREIGLHVVGAFTFADLGGVVIEGTLPSDCPTELCPMPAPGIGAGAYDGAAMVVSNFRIDGNAICGIQLARGGVMDLSDGVVSHHPIGANVQDPAFDVARLSTRVSYVDNDTTLDSAALAIPVPAAALSIGE